jgi:hypothetical protein
VHELLGLPPLPHHTLHASDTVRATSSHQPLPLALGTNAHFFLIEFLYKTQIKSNKRPKKRLLFGYNKKQ